MRAGPANEFMDGGWGRRLKPRLGGTKSPPGTPPPAPGVCMARACLTPDADAPRAGDSRNRVGETPSGAGPPYSIRAYEMYGSHSRRWSGSLFSPSASIAASVSPGQMGLSNSSKARIAPLGIRGTNASSAAFVGS